MENLFNHDYCEETKAKQLELHPVEWLMYFGKHMKACGKCLKAFEKYKSGIKELYKRQKPDVLGLNE